VDRRWVCSRSDDWYADWDGAEMTTIEKLPDGGVEVTFDSEETYALKVESYKNKEWDHDGLLTFIKDQRKKGIHSQKIVKKLGLTNRHFRNCERLLELNHRENLLNLVVRRPLTETYLWHIGYGEKDDPKTAA